MSFLPFKKHLRIASFFISLFFTFNTLAWGQVPLSSISFPPEWTALHVSVPQKLGSVKNQLNHAVTPTPERPFLIHIQDAHSNYAAQKNTAAILEHLRQTQKIDLVFVEAATGNLDAENLQFTPDEALNRKIADKLAKMGELTAADLYLFQHGNRKLKFVGMEDAPLYRRDIECLREVLSREEEIEDWIRSDERALDRELTRLANKDLLLLLRQFLHLEKKESSLIKTVSILDQISRQSLGRGFRDPKEQKEFPNLVRLLMLKDEEGKMDRAKIDAEIKEIEKLGVKIDLKAGNPRFLLEKLYSDFKSHGFDFNKYPHFTAYARNLIFQHELKSEGLFEELNQWMALLINSAAKTDEERRMALQIKDAKLLHKLLLLELTREEWEDVRSKFVVANLFAKEERLKSLLQASLNFYHLAVSRDHAFIENIRKILKSKKTNRAVVITGGFHTDALLENFTNHAVISPKVEGDSRENYVKTMLGRRAESISESDAASVAYAVPVSIATGLGVDSGQRLSLVNSIRSRLESSGENFRIPVAASSLAGKSLGDGIDDGQSPPKKSFGKWILMALPLVLGIFAGMLLVRPTKQDDEKKVPQQQNPPQGTVNNPGQPPGQKLPAPVPPAESQRPAYRFAPNYSRAEIQSNPDAARRFLDEVIRWEARFNQPGIGYHAATGMTFDGHDIDFDTGELRGGPRNWSAASKESLHVGLLALAVLGRDPRAQIFMSPDNPSQAAQTAVDILTRKIFTYEKFNREYPGYGGFLPWYIIEADGIRPAGSEDSLSWDWRSRVPALDNGQLMWSLYLAYHALEEKGHTELARRYRDYFRLMVRNSVMMFYDGDGKIRAESKIANTRAVPSRDNYSNNVSGYFLDDPYEGELFAFAMVLFGDWSHFGGEAETEKIWQVKRAKLEPVLYQTPHGPITVARGHWFSAHEQWKWFVLPYLDVDIAARVFRQSEAARTWNSATNKFPGLFASVHDVVTDRNQNPRYLSELGIPPIARQPVTRRDVVTPYAVFPVILAGPVGVGASWLHVMLSGPRMQGPYGSTESVNIAGTGFAPVLTWDSKITTVVAILGGFHPEIGRSMRADGVYDRFICIVDKEHRAAFPNLQGRNIPFAFPTAEIPHALSDFTVNRGTSSGGQILEQAIFDGGGELKERYRFAGGVLTMPQSQGYVWTRTPQVDLEKNPFVHLSVRTRRETALFIEVKNTEDRLVTEQKTALQFPSTGGEVRSFLIDLRQQKLAHPNKTAGILVFSDPSSELEIHSVEFGGAARTGSVQLGFDGRRFTQGGAPQQNQVEGDLLGKINFNRGGNLQFEHNQALVLRQSGGWIWAHIPETDLQAKPVLVLRVKTNEPGSFWMEIKNGADQPLVGQSRFGVSKLEISVPDTNDEFRTISIDLRSQFRAGVQDKKARIIAISDPSGTLEIRGMAFSAEARSLGNKISGDIQPTPDEIKAFLSELEARNSGFSSVEPNRIAGILKLWKSENREIDGIIPVSLDVTRKIFAPGDGTVLGDLLDLFLGMGIAEAQTVDPKFLTPGFSIEQFTQFVAGRLIPQALPEEPVAIIVTESRIEGRQERIEALKSILRPGDLVEVIDNPETEFDPAAELRKALRGKEAIVKSRKTQSPLLAELKRDLRLFETRFSLEDLKDTIKLPDSNGKYVRFKINRQELLRQQVDDRVVISLLRMLAKVKNPEAQKLIYHKAGLEPLADGWLVGEGFVASLTEALMAYNEAVKATAQSA